MEQQTQPWFSEQNISAMRAAYLKESDEAQQSISDVLEANRTKLINFMQRTGLTPSNISSIFNGIGHNPLNKGIQNLLKSQQTFIDLTEDRIFIPANIVSMLGPSRHHVYDATQALLKAKPQLVAFIDNSRYSPYEVTQMLRLSGKHIDASARDLLSRQDKLHNLAKTFSSQLVVNELSKTSTDSAKGIGFRIDAMYTKYSSEIEGRTNIPPGTKPVIATRPKKSMEIE